MSEIDYYDLVEAGAFTLAKELPQIKDTKKQMSRGDDSILSNGFLYFLRFKPGTFSISPMDTSNHLAEWTVTIEIYARFSVNLETTWENFRTFRSAIINKYMHDRTLNGTFSVLDLVVDGGTEPEYLSFEQDSKDKPVHIYQALTLTVSQKAEFIKR